MTTSNGVHQRRRTGISFEADGEHIIVDVERPFQMIDLEEALEADRALHAAYRDAHGARRRRLVARRAIAGGSPDGELPAALEAAAAAGDRALEALVGPDEPAFRAPGESAIDQEIRLFSHETMVRRLCGRWAGFTREELVCLEIVLTRDCRRPSPAPIAQDLRRELETAIAMLFELDSHKAGYRG